MIDFGKDVILGKFGKENLEFLRSLRNDQRIWGWCRQNDLISELQQEAWYSRQDSDPYTRMYAVCTHEPGNRLVGVCGLTSIDYVNRRAEFSLYIDPEEQRKGYASAALQTLCLHGFRNLNLNCIWGETFEGNPAIQLFEKLGFQKEGTRREFYFRDGRYIAAHLYSLLARECYFDRVADDKKEPATPSHPLDAAEVPFGPVSFFQAQEPGKAETHRPNRGG